MNDSPGYLPFRLEVAGTLKAESAYHIGTGERWDPATDAPILRGPDGLPYLPGASLRGIIRAHLNREHWLLGCGREAFERLFGKFSERRGNGSNNVASRLRVEDAWLAGDVPADSEVRDHVRIDREYGSAADKAKFDQEVASKGAEFGFRLIYEGHTADDRELLLIAEAIRQLEEGSLRVGAKSGWGLGCVRLSGVQYLAFDRSTDDGFARYLGWRAGGAALADVWTPPPGRVALAWEGNRPFNVLDFNLTLRFEGPVLVKAAIPPTMPEDYVADPKLIEHPGRYAKRGELVADHVFLSDRGGRYYLPGSSLRGVMRSEAAWICETIQLPRKLEHLLFGTAKGGEGGEGRKGRVEISDGDPPPDAQLVYLDHVAIDRITNAAADGLKFSTCGLDSPEFVVHVRLRYEPGEENLAALWILLIRALESGRLWAGSGVTRGYGYIAGASIGVVRCSFATPGGRSDEELTVDDLAVRLQPEWDAARGEAA